MRVYLAGPDVFRPDAAARGAALKAVCAEHGLLGVFPLDPLAGEPGEWSALAPALRIALCNEAHIRGAAALIANLTPFRGPSADPGTVFELGYARARGVPLFGWSEDARPFSARTVAWLGAVATAASGGGPRDGEGFAVESFGCVDNLMLDGAIAASGGAIELAGPGEAGGLAPFRRCVARLSGLLRASGG